MAGAANPGQAQAAGGPNVFSQASSALQRGIGMAGGAGALPQVSFSQATAPTLNASSIPGVSVGNASRFMSQYMNPYTQDVIDRTQADIARQQEMGLNQLGAQATAARAFGGSRHGVAEGVAMGEYGRAMGDIAAQQRAQGFQTALGAAQQDVGNQLQANLAAQQLRGQYAMANLDAGTRMALANQQAQMEAQRLNQQAALQQGQQQIQGAGVLGNLAQTGFGFGQQIGQQQAQQGAMMQMLNQQLIDAARGQYAGFTGAPQQSLGLPMAAVGAGNMGQRTQTTSQSPGLFDFLALGASLAGSDRRLKINIQPLGERNGVKLYSWDWNDEGKRLADPAQPTVGVIADELMQTHPHLVHRGADGYLRVDYSGLQL